MAAEAVEARPPIPSRTEAYYGLQTQNMKECTEKEGQHNRGREK